MSLLTLATLVQVKEKGFRFLASSEIETFSPICERSEQKRFNSENFDCFRLLRFQRPTRFGHQKIVNK
jgi:hypothetical protein